MTNIFLKILNMSISASLLILAVLILRMFFKNAPKWIKVLLWGIVAVRLICPAFIESEISLIPKKEYITNNDIKMQVEISSMDDISASDTSTIYTSAYDEPTTSDTTIGNTSISDISISDTSINDTSINGKPIGNTSISDTSIGADVNKEPLSEEPERNNVYIRTLIPIAAKIWIFGIGFMVLYLGISYIRLYQKIKTAVLLKNNVFQSENVFSPFILGIISPKIYIPLCMEEKEIHYVVSHEKAHLSRKDHWWKPFGFLLLTVYWFNPLMWIAYVLLCRDIEFACDEKVIKDMSDSQKADYSQILLSFSTRKRISSACPVAFGEVGVKSRIHSVLNYKKPSFWIIAISIISCVVFTFFFLTDPKDEAELSSEFISDEISSSEQSSFEDVESSDVSTDENASGDEIQDVIYDENGIKILVENIVFESSKEPHVEFLFENNSETDYLFNIQDMSVNGYMVDSSLNGNGIAVKTKKGTQQHVFVTIDDSSLEKCGIELISDIEISFWILDEINKETFFTTPMLKIKSPIYDTNSPTVNHSGYIAYNDNDVKIVVKGFRDFDFSKNKGIEVYIENNSKKTVIIRAKVVSINGYDIDPLFYTAPLYYTEYPMVTRHILPSKKSVGGLSFKSEDLEAHNITEINSMELYFYIEDWETASDIGQTDIIRLERDYFSVPSKNPDEPSIMHWATEINFTKEEFFAWLEGNFEYYIKTFY